MTIRAAKAYEVYHALNQASNFSKSAWTFIINMKIQPHPKPTQIEMNGVVSDYSIQVAPTFNTFFWSFWRGQRSTTGPKVW